MRPLYFLLYSVLGAIAVNCQSAVAVEWIQKPLTVGQTLNLSSEVLNETREIQVYLPNDYSSDKRYQVIYLLDAEYLFLPTLGIVDSLVKSRRLPDAIVVGINTTVRVRDYLPTIDGKPKSPQQRWIQNKFPVFGGAEKFQEFLRTELFPVIEDNFSGLPNRTLVGYSNGGVFGLHTLVNNAEMFSHYLLISPSAWWGAQEIDEYISTFSAMDTTKRSNLFLSVANEGGGFYANVMRIAASFESNAPEDFNWTIKHFDSESHQTTIYPSISLGLETLFAEFYFDVPDALGEHLNLQDVTEYYGKLSDKYGYEVPVPESVYMDLADAQMSGMRQEAALKTLKMFVSAYPNSSVAHSSLGSGYMKNQQMQKAYNSFEKAMKIVEANNVKDSSILDFLNNMMAITKP